MLFVLIWADLPIGFRVVSIPANTVLVMLVLVPVAHLVLGGEGWKLRDFYTEGGLEKHLEYAGKVDILTLENFIARANQGQL